MEGWKTDEKHLDVLRSNLRSLSNLGGSKNWAMDTISWGPAMQWASSFKSSKSSPRTAGSFYPCLWSESPVDSGKHLIIFIYIYIYLLGLIRSQVSTCFNHPKLVQEFAAPLYLLPPFDDKNCRSQICHGSGSSGSSGSAPGLPGLGQQLRRGGDKASRGLRLRQDLRDGRQNHDLPNVFPRNWEWTGESVDLIWFNWFD